VSGITCLRFDYYFSTTYLTIPVGPEFRYISWGPARGLWKSWDSPLGCAPKADCERSDLLGKGVGVLFHWLCMHCSLTRSQIGRSGWQPQRESFCKLCGFLATERRFEICYDKMIRHELSSNIVYANQSRCFSISNALL
jgi:hypothetical protein